MSLVRHYTLQDNAASTTIVGAVGGNGTLQGGDNTSVKSTTGPGGSYPLALNFNGSDDYITFPSVSIAAVGTWCFWAKYTATGAIQSVISNANSGSTNRIGFSPGSTTMMCRMVNGGTSATPAHGVTATDWHHYLFARNAANIVSFYVDGALVNANIFGSAQSGSATWSQIAANSTAIFPFTGDLADVRMYDSDESANAAAIYAEGVSGGGSSTIDHTGIILRHILGGGL